MFPRRVGNGIEAWMAVRWLDPPCRGYPSRCGCGMIITNRADGQKLFTEGKYLAEGDLVFTKFKDLFGR